jgi:catechol 2,3-dioxygenase-like lactoylglutathione lyase family enzyme
MTEPPLPPHYHVGIVVRDLVAARALLREQLGVAWGPIVHVDATEYRDEAGHDVVLPTTMCYSAGTPCLELIEEVPGSVWECNEHSNLHHIGFWIDDLPARSAELGASRCPMQLCGRAGADAPVTFAYHRNELGVRVELVDAGMRDMMAALFEPQAD